MSYMLPILSAVLLALPMLYAKLWPLAWVALVPLLFELYKPCSLKIFLLKIFSFSFFYNGILVAFIFSLSRFISGFTIFSWLGLNLFYSSFFILWGLFAYRVYTNNIFVVWLIPVSLTLLEILKVHIGFLPSMDVYYSQVLFLPLVQIASLFGSHVISLAIYALNQLFAEWWAYKEVVRPKFTFKKNRHYIQAYIIMGLVFLYIVSWGFRHIDNYISKQSLINKNAIIVQTNVSQEEKLSAKNKAYLFYKQIVLINSYTNKDADVILYPEDLISSVLDLKFLDKSIHDLNIDDQVHLIFGMPTFIENKYYNSVLFHNKESEIKVYRKHYLVPFGEYLPFSTGLKKHLKYDWLFQAEFSKSFNSDPVTFRSVNYGVAICIESLFQTLSLYQVKQGAEVLLVLTNDDWFSKTSALERHFQYSKFRAIETGRYMLFAANTGVSGIITPLGTEVTRSNKYSQEIINGNFSLISHKTLYVKQPHLIVFVLFGIFVLLLVSKKYLLSKDIAEVIEK